MLFSNRSRSSQRINEQTNGIPHRRICGRTKKCEQYPAWRPWSLKLHHTYHRIFIDAEEQAVADHISANWLLSGLLFTDASFVEIVTTAFLKKYKGTEPAWSSSAPLALFIISNTEISSLLAGRI
jgi:hypothetical protein